MNIEQGHYLTKAENYPTHEAIHDEWSQFPNAYQDK